MSDVETEIHLRDTEGGGFIILRGDRQYALSDANYADYLDALRDEDGVQKFEGEDGLAKLHRRGLIGAAMTLAAGRGRAAADGSSGVKAVAALRAAQEYRKRLGAVAGDNPTRRKLVGAMGLASMGKADLAKAWAGHKHPREHDGKFASKNGETAGRFAAGAVGVAGGAYVGLKHGADIGEKAGRLAGVGYVRAREAMNRMKDLETPDRVYFQADKAKRIGRHLGNRYGLAAGGAALGAAGYLAGGAAGRKVDEMGRRSRAKAAGRLDVYERLNTPQPSLTRKDVKAAAKEANSKSRKAQRLYEFAQGLAAL